MQLNTFGPLRPATRIYQNRVISLARRYFSQTSPCQTAYGFIGLGAMGYPMAQNLRNKISASDSLLIHDLNAKATTQFKEEAAPIGCVEVMQDVKQVADSSDTIITVLPEPDHVRTVYDNILAARSLAPVPTKPYKSRLFIDCSTIDPITSRAVALDVTTTLGKEVAAFVDAPMSGGVVGARAAKLTFMLGAGEAYVERARAVLSMMGARIVHLGDQGAGLAGKLANNYALAVNNIAAAEAMSMAMQWGLDAKVFAGMMNSATGRSWPSEVNNPVPGVVEGAPAGRGYEGGFGLNLMRKDLGLAIESAKEYGVKYGLGDRAMEMYREAEADKRCHGKDFSSIYLWLDGPGAGDDKR